MTGLSLGWVPTRGAVRFTLTNPTAKQTVMRVVPGGVLQQIRGYPTDTWWAGTTSAIGYDYEMPLGVTVTYAVVPYTARTLPAGAVTATIFTMTPGSPNGEAWLRDVLQPILSVPTSFVSSGDETRAARQNVLEIAGRANAYVVWDTRAARSGTVQLAVKNEPTPGVWTVPTNRDKLETLFLSGRPLLLSVCDQVGFKPCYMAIGDVSTGVASAMAGVARQTSHGSRRIARHERRADAGLAERTLRRIVRKAARDQRPRQRGPRNCRWLERQG